MSTIKRIIGFKGLTIAMVKKANINTDPWRNICEYCIFGTFNCEVYNVPFCGTRDYDLFPNCMNRTSDVFYPNAELFKKFRKSLKQNNGTQAWRML